MAFYLYFGIGILGGVLGGMGMGGGTALIPLLVLLTGTEQAAAQGVNLLSFLPMSLVALSVHAKKGLVRPKAAIYLALPALITSVLFSFLSALIPPPVLRTAFGAALVILAAVRLRDALFLRSFFQKM